MRGKHIWFRRLESGVAHQAGETEGLGYGCDGRHGASRGVPGMTRLPCQVWENVTAPFAYLSMEVAQSVDSYEIITEINPWEIAEFFGNIGGFWGE